jgi:hypothetical protein
VCMTRRSQLFWLRARVELNALVLRATINKATDVVGVRSTVVSCNRTQDGSTCRVPHVYAAHAASEAPAQDDTIDAYLSRERHNA